MLCYPIENNSNLLCTVCAVIKPTYRAYYMYVYTHILQIQQKQEEHTNKQIQVTTGYKQQHEQQEQLIAASAVYQINCACKSTFHRVGA